MSIIAKMEVHNLDQHRRPHNPQLDETESGQYVTENLKMSAFLESDDEVNSKWAQFTPSADLSISIDNPRAQGHFRPGDTVYVVITKDQAYARELAKSPAEEGLSSRKPF